MIDARDWAVIEQLQTGIGLEERPFDALAAKAEIPVSEFLTRMERLRREGVIRRMGVRIRHNKAGVEGNVLTVWRVPDPDVERVGKLFASMPEVSHCYTRATRPGFHYNLYAMAHAQTPAAAEAVSQRMAQESGINDFVALRTVRELKKSTPRYKRPSE